jgi:hypothetical protein
MTERWVSIRRAGKQAGGSAGAEKIATGSIQVLTRVHLSVKVQQKPASPRACAVGGSEGVNRDAPGGIPRCPFFFDCRLRACVSAFAGSADPRYPRFIDCSSTEHTEARGKCKVQIYRMQKANCEARRLMQWTVAGQRCSRSAGGAHDELFNAAAIAAGLFNRCSNSSQPPEIWPNVLNNRSVEHAVRGWLTREYPCHPRFITGTTEPSRAKFNTGPLCAGVEYDGGVLRRKGLG